MHDLARHRCGEQQRLSRLRLGERGNDAANRLDEAHVEHAIGLVEHEHPHGREIHEPLLHKVDQAAGGGDQYVHAALQRFDLVILADAAEDDGVREAGVAAVDGETLADLRRQFACRREHEDPRQRGAAPGFVGRLGVQAVQDRQRERGGLAGAGLGAAQQVAPFEHGRDRLGLDGRGGRVAFGVQRTEDGVGKAKGRKLQQDE